MKRTFGNRLAVVLLAVFVTLVAIWLVAPSLVIVPLSFTDRPSFVFPPQGWSLDWYRNILDDPRWLNALGTSLRVALWVTVLAVLLGTAAALALDRLPRKLSGAFQMLLLSPLLAPQIVVAVAIFAQFIRWRIDGTELGIVCAHLILAIPYVLVTVSASLAKYDRRLDRAADSLGARPWERLVTVTLPGIAPGVAIGAVFAFVTSFDEAVIALFIQSPTTRTLPVQMYNSVTVEIDPTIAAISSIILAVTTAVLLIPLLGGKKKRVRSS